MEKDCAFANLEDKYTFKIKEKQRVAVESILDGKDTFIVLPTENLPFCYTMCFVNDHSLQRIMESTLDKASPPGPRC
jgi:hypothetical protein